MYDVHIRKIPDKLLPMVKNGQVKVYGGVIKDNVTGKVVGHLEQLGSIGIREIVNFMPNNDISSIVKLVQNQKIISQLNHVTNLIKGLQTLSWVNVALSGVNMGISLVGFSILNSKLNTIKTSLKMMEKKMDILLEKADSQIENESSKIFAQASTYIDNIRLFMSDLEAKGLNESINLQIGRELNEIKYFLQHIINQYKSRSEIRIGFEIIMLLYVAYLNLLNMYIIHRRTNNYDISLYNNAGKGILDEMLSKEMINCIYQDYIFSNEKLYTEHDIRSIIDIYKFSCEENYRVVDSQYQLLKEISIENYACIREKVNYIKNVEDTRIVLVTH